MTQINKPTKPPPFEAFGKSLRALMGAVGSDPVRATRSGFSLETINGWRNGTHKPSSLHELWRLVDDMEISFPENSGSSQLIFVPDSNHSMNDPTAGKANAPNARQMKEYAMPGQKHDTNQLLRNLLTAFDPELKWSEEKEWKISVRQSFFKYDGRAALSPIWLHRQPAHRQLGLYLQACREGKAISVEGAAKASHIAEVKQLLDLESGKIHPRVLSDIEPLFKLYTGTIQGNVVFDRDYAEDLLRNAQMDQSPGLRSATLFAEYFNPEKLEKLPERERFGLYLAACREAHNMSLTVAAKILGETTEQLDAYENGSRIYKRSHFTSDNFREFCAAAPHPTQYPFSDKYFGELYLTSEKALHSVEKPVAAFGEVDADTQSTSTPPVNKKTAGRPSNKSAKPVIEKIAEYYQKKGWEKEEPINRFATFVWACRIMSKLNQKEVEEMLGYNHTTYSEIEGGKFVPRLDSPRIAGIRKMCEDVDPDYTAMHFDELHAISRQAHKDKSRKVRSEEGILGLKARSKKNVLPKVSFEDRPWETCPPDEAFRTYVKACRVKRGLNQHAIGNKVHIFQSIVSKIELGETLPNNEKTECYAAFCAEVDPQFDRGEFDRMRDNAQMTAAVKSKKRGAVPLSNVTEPDVNHGSASREKGIG